MADLPFTRPARPIRDCGPPTARAPLGDLIFHTPLNTQVSTSRSIQTGTFRGPEVKSNMRRVDARLDQVERNRENLFFDSSLKDLPQTSQSARRSFSPPTAKRLTTRHDHTPYDYSTRWISHPDDNTSLYGAPSETFRTSYMATPCSDSDKINREKSINQKYAALRRNQEHFLGMVNSIDQKKKSINEMNTRNIRRQRADFLSTLSIRQEKEFSKIFQ
ncbi:hypothetical protein TRFO_10180 [Tritrichomonas foetus]|uniref:Uncharacterized protein n=1 Tax=Tritrichomonas foetus TaxID=1144522 RepID=A0A1J4JBG4_9EUKA|nr:hypothetical protein TRFO_10180 [Tritrichomonas foetus]|eukprot:OHS96009.1 hypothetical protein TRFO_10180 [Tritrichomonas foetus]